VPAPVPGRFVAAVKKSAYGKPLADDMRSGRDGFLPERLQEDAPDSKPLEEKAWEMVAFMPCSALIPTQILWKAEPPAGVLLSNNRNREAISP